jgi:hypothetical protein
VFGPEIAYRRAASEDWFIEPRVAIRDLDLQRRRRHRWRRYRSVRARLEGGLRIEGLDGTRLDLQGTYDGLGGDNLDAVSGKASVTLPLD